MGQELSKQQQFEVGGSPAFVPHELGCVGRRFVLVPAFGLRDMRSAFAALARTAVCDAPRTPS